MMLFSFLEVGAVGFWILLFISAVVVSSLVDDDRFGSATLVALGTLGLLALLGNFNPVMLVRDHPREALLAIPAYLTTGIFWCYLKWTLFVGAARRQVDVAHGRFTEVVAQKEHLLAEDERKLVQDLEELASHTARGSTASATDGGFPESVRSSPRLADGQREFESSRKELAARRERMNSDEWRKEIWHATLRESGIRGSAKPMVRENRARVLAWLSYWPASMAWTLIDDPVRRAFLAIYESIGGSLQRISDRKFAGVEDIYKAPPHGTERH